MTQSEIREIREQIRVAAEEVRKWPAWMQNILEDRQNQW